MPSIWKQKGEVLLGQGLWTRWNLQNSAVINRGTRKELWNFKSMWVYMCLIPH